MLSLLLPSSFTKDDLLLCFASVSRRPAIGAEREAFGKPSRTRDAFASDGEENSNKNGDDDDGEYGDKDEHERCTACHAIFTTFG